VTGDELVSAPAPLGFGQRYDSNAALLAALCVEHGATVACCARRRLRRDREPSARGRRRRRIS
jgi:molybdopterin biosynthesis enzyme